MRGAARGRWAARWPSADVRSEGWSPTSGSACACPRWPAPRTASGWWAPARRPQPCAGCYSPWTGSRASSRSAATGAGCRCWSLQRKHEGTLVAGLKHYYYYIILTFIRNKNDWTCSMTSFLLCSSSGIYHCKQQWWFSHLFFVLECNGAALYILMIQKSRASTLHCK